MTQRHRERMVLTLPADPALAGLAHLAALHFFRQNGVAVLEARRSARTVRSRARIILRLGARQARRGRSVLALVLTSGARSLEVVLRTGAGAAGSLLVCLRRRDPA